MHTWGDPPWRISNSRTANGWYTWSKMSLRAFLDRALSSSVNTYKKHVFGFCEIQTRQAIGGNALQYWTKMLVRGEGGKLLLPLDFLLPGGSYNTETLLALSPSPHPLLGRRSHWFIWLVSSGMHRWARSSSISWERAHVLFCSSLP